MTRPASRCTALSWSVAAPRDLNWSRSSAIASAGARGPRSLWSNVPGPVSGSRSRTRSPMGSIDPGEYEVNYLAQAHWHAFRYRFGEMIGLDRTSKEVRLAAAFDDEGREITPPRSVEYDTLVIAIGSVTNDFGTRGVAQYAVPLETPAQAGRVHRRPGHALLSGATQGGPGGPRPPHMA